MPILLIVSFPPVKKKLTHLVYSPDQPLLPLFLFDGIKIAFAAVINPINRQSPPPPCSADIYSKIFSREILMNIFRFRLYCIINQPIKQRGSESSECSSVERKRKRAGATEEAPPGLNVDDIGGGGACAGIGVGIGIGSSGPLNSAVIVASGGGESLIVPGASQAKKVLRLLFCVLESHRKV